MKADPSAQRRLLDLADLDDRIGRTRQQKQQPPQAGRIKELVAQRQELAGELAARVGARDDLRAELDRVEGDVRVVEARRARDEALLATVTNPKDAQGLEHELASLATRLGELEDAQLALMQRNEEADSAVAAQEQAIASLNEEGARLSVEAKQLVADADGALDALGRDRAATAATVEEPLRALYERLRERSSGAALLRARTCGGCHMLLAGTDLRAIADAAPDEVLFCPECGCVLVRTEESGL